MASLTVLDGTGAASAALSVPQDENPLADVTEAYAEWQKAADRAQRYRSVLVECVLDARADGRKLAEIAAAMGVTRQMVQKIIRVAERAGAEDEAEAAYYAAKARADERAQLRGLGFTPKNRQCGVCHWFKSRPSDVCDHCGDDPVTYSQGGPDSVDRAAYDAAYVGGIR